MIVLAVLAAVAYGAGVLRLRRRGDRWPPAQAWAALVGLGCYGVATVPHLPAPGGQFGGHVLQHLLLASLASALLAFGAPLTLALRTLPRPARSALLALLHSRLARVASNPILLAVLTVAPLYALYLTDLYALAQQHWLLHVLVHLHMAVGGYLLATVLIGADPMPRRPGLLARLALLLTVAAAHNVLAKLMYATTLPHGAGTPEEVRTGAQLMFYGGDVAEVLLLVLVLSRAYARGGAGLARQRRRTTVGAEGR